MTKGYIYETHLHTKEASACSVSSGASYIEPYIKRGYDGIIVTDHFYGGNTAIPRDLPWNEWVDAFCRGYENAKEEGDKKGLKVFFGWEECFEGDEYLIYGLDKEWLKAHPEVKGWTHVEQYNTIHRDGGLIVQAHPFRERNYLKEVHLHPYQADAVEVYNTGNKAYQDALAFRYADKFKFITTSGSDIHNSDEINNQPGGMVFDKQLRSIDDFVSIMKTGTGFSPILYMDHKSQKDDYNINLPMYIHNAENERRKVELKDIFEE